MHSLGDRQGRAGGIEIFPGQFSCPGVALAKDSSIIMADQEQSDQSKRVYVGNMPYHAQREDLEKFLIEAGFQIERLDMTIDPFTGRNPSYCFVEFPSLAEAQRAISELPGAHFMGRPLKANVHTPKRNDRQQQQQDERARPAPKAFEQHNRRPQAVQPPNRGGSYAFDRWNRSDAKAHWTAPQEQGRRVYVGGLPRITGQDTVNDEMKALFKDFNVEAVSKIISPHPSKSEEPGSHHYCFVDLASKEEVDQAVEQLDGSPTPWEGTFKVNRARDKTTRKVFREQNIPEAAAAPEPPRRDLSGSWRTLA